MLPLLSRRVSCSQGVATAALVVGITATFTACTAARSRTAGSTPKVASSGNPTGRCLSSDLRLVAGAYGEAAGSFAQTFTFTNVSGASCSLRGWPTFEIESPTGQSAVTPTEKVRQTTPPAAAFGSVVVPPQGAASFRVFNADFDAAAGSSCPKTAAVLVMPPGSTVFMRVAVQIPDCPYSFNVAPIIAGPTDPDAWSTVVG